jgi:hypothetical protein
MEKLEQERDFWKHLNQKTVSLDRLKAQFMDDMLKDAVKLLRQVYEEKPWLSIKDFLELHDRTWGKDSYVEKRKEMYDD